MQANPHMKVWVGQGYYDLATPHLGALYHFSHMGLGPELHQNIEYHFYEAGHMFYLDVTSLAKLRQNIEAFYQIKA
jgi:carboxypeptidase C (cathepsin A)